MGKRPITFTILGAGLLFLVYLARQQRLSEFFGAFNLSGTAQAATGGGANAPAAGWSQFLKVPLGNTRIGARRGGGTVPVLPPQPPDILPTKPWLPPLGVPYNPKRRLP